MGVAASTSFSVVQDRKLAALFGAHHHEPRLLSYRRLTRCLRVVELFSNRSALLELRSRQENLRARQASLLDLSETFAAARCEFIEFVTAHHARIAALLDSDAVAAVQGEKVFSDALTDSEVWRLVAACKPRLDERGVFAIDLRHEAGSMLLWLRREVVIGRIWRGDPKQTLHPSANGHVSPRASFETYVEQLSGTSSPWQSHSIDLAMAMKHACAQILVGHYARRAQEEAERANRLKTEFLTNVTHELRTLLHSIFGFSDAIFERGAAIAPERQKQYLQVIRSSGQRLLALIDDLLELAKLESGATSPRDGCVATIPRAAN